MPGYIDFPGSSGNYLSVPDAANLDITGDISLVARVAMDDWSPAAAQTVVSKVLTATNNVSYELRVTAAGLLVLRWSPDGTSGAAIGPNSTLGLSALANGAWKWIGATLDVNDGAGGRDVRYMTSDDGVNWVPLGTTVHGAATTNIFSGSALLNVSGINAGASQALAGQVSDISVRNGIGPAGAIGGAEVFGFGPMNLVGVDEDATQFTAATGQVVTINRSGSPSTFVVPTLLRSSRGCSPAGPGQIPLTGGTPFDPACHDRVAC